MKSPTIDRIDNDGDYTFENCRFIENGENTRRRGFTVEHRIKLSLGASRKAKREGKKIKGGGKWGWVYG